MTISARLKKARKKRRFTQRQVAALAGIAQQSYQEIESGQTKNPTCIIELSNVLEIDPGWLHYGSGPDPFEKHQIPQGFIPIIDWGYVKSWVYKSENLITENTKFVPAPFLAPPFHQKLPDHLYALTVKGNAMVGTEKSFTPGSIIIVAPFSPKKPGDYVIAAEIAAKEAIFRRYDAEGLVALQGGYAVKEDIEKYEFFGVVVAHVDILL